LSSDLSKNPPSALARSCAPRLAANTAQAREVRMALDFVFLYALIFSSRCVQVSEGALGRGVFRMAGVKNELRFEYQRQRRHDEEGSQCRNGQPQADQHAHLRLKTQ